MKIQAMNHVKKYVPIPIFNADDLSMLNLLPRRSDNGKYNATPRVKDESPPRRFIDRRKPKMVAMTEARRTFVQ